MDVPLAEDTLPGCAYGLYAGRCWYDDAVWFDGLREGWAGLKAGAVGLGKRGELPNEDAYTPGELGWLLPFPFGRRETDPYGEEKPCEGGGSAWPNELLRAAGAKGLALCCAKRPFGFG